MWSIKYKVAWKQNTQVKYLKFEQYLSKCTVATNRMLFRLVYKIKTQQMWCVLLLFTSVRPLCLLPSAAIRSDRSDLVKLLLLRGSRVNQEGCHGRRPLHEASRLGKAALVSLLLEAGARPDPRSHYGITPLALAAQGGHLEVVATLLKTGERARMSPQYNYMTIHICSITLTSIHI